MPTVQLHNGVPLLVDGAVAVDPACCCDDGSGDCPCPDLSTLCVSISLTDYDGNVYTADETNMSWTEAGDYGVVYLGGGFAYSVEVSCTQGVVNITAGWAGFIENCNCTSGTGTALLSCTPETQSTYYLDSVTFDIDFYDIGEPCNQNCPAKPGSVTVTISEPPC